MNYTSPIRRVGLAALLFVAALPWLAMRTASAQITRILAIGDSGTDTGNMFDASGGTVGGPPYWEGHFSNGPVWIEYLADGLGVPRPTPSRLGGTNAAYGGATTGYGAFVDTRQNNVEVPRGDVQIDEILAKHTPGDHDLVVVWFGHNDLSTDLPGGPLPPAPIINNLTDHITTLYDAGARNFLVGNLWPDPLYDVVSFPLPATINELRRSLPSAALVLLDFRQVIHDVRSNPEAFGFTSPFFNPIINLNLPDPDRYAIWDQFGHATTALHRVIAETALEALQSLDGDYNGDGLVEQGDLDLVLLNWGKVARPAPVGWVDNPPFRFIDQEELDQALVNWGRERLVPRTDLASATIPEPASSLLVLVALIVVLTSSGRSAHRQ